MNVAVSFSINPVSFSINQKVHLLGNFDKKIEFLVGF